MEESNNLNGVNGGFIPMDQFLTNGWNFEYLCFTNLLQEEDNFDLISEPPSMLHQLQQPSSFSPLPPPISSAFDYPFPGMLQDIINSSDPPPLVLQASQGNNSNKNINVSPLMEESKSFLSNKKKGNKKLEGQPSKNLMAERRRRKRLNDRLSMLRSIVPKITKSICNGRNSFKVS